MSQHHCPYSHIQKASDSELRLIYAPNYSMACDYVMTKIQRRLYTDENDEDDDDDDDFDNDVTITTTMTIMMAAMMLSILLAPSIFKG